MDKKEPWASFISLKFNNLFWVFILFLLSEKLKMKRFIYYRILYYRYIPLKLQVVNWTLKYLFFYSGSNDINSLDKNVKAERKINVI